PARAARIERLTAWAHDGLRFDPLYARAIVRPFVAIARELERGAERANGDASDTIARGMSAASRVLRRVPLEDARAQQTLLLAGTVVLLAFWTLSGWGTR